jgi:predicted permease
MQTFVQDLRHAIVTARRDPAFWAAAVATLALGIGATTAVFSVVYGVLVQPLPYAAGARLIRVWEEHPGGVSPAGNRWLSNHTYSAWVARPRTLDGIGAYATYEYTVAVGGEPERIVGSAVSPTVFALLGAAPRLGRFFTPGEGREGAESAVVLSEPFWRNRFGADPEILGRPLTIDEQAHTIVGVAPAGLRFPESRVQFWIPQSVPAVAPGATRAFTALARLRPGVTVSQAETEGTAVARSVPRPPMSTELFFGRGGPVVVRARLLAEDMTGSIRPALLVMAGAATLVLFISCANVATLLLSRGIARRRELAIRAALGGSRGRLVRHLLTEAAALCAAGGVAGVLLAAALVRALPLLAPDRFPRLDDVRIDAGMLAIAAAATVVAAMISGLVPAMRGARCDLQEVVRSSADRGGGFRTQRWRQAVLVLESAFAVTLVVGAGLLAHSLVRLLRVDAGYAAEHVLAVRAQLPRSASAERVGAFIDAVLERLRATPGVTAAGAGNMMPLWSATAIGTFPLPAAPGEVPRRTRSVTYVVTPGYAEALGLRLKQGRWFTETDRLPGTRKMLVNEEFVRQYLTGTVVGRRFGDLFLNDRDTTTEIVGIVGNVLKDGNDRQPQPEIYFVHGSPTRRIDGAVNIAVRAGGDAASLGGLVRTIVRDADRTAIVELAAPLADLVARSVDQPRFATRVLTAFASLALLLACVGLYGMLSCNVTQRRRELGIRAAVGADRGDLVRLVMREGLIVTLAGVGPGLLAAAWLTQFMRAILFGVTPLDATAFLTAPVVLLAVAALACVLPAWRAAATDPAVALRAE